MAKELWVEKYRPSKVEDYVFRDDRLKQQVNNWIKENNIPHLLLHGPAGTGKSSLANVLLKSLNINPGDVMYINASDQTGVDTIRDKIQGFISTFPIGEFKVVLVEEADYMSPNAQAALRRVMEDYAAAARFILTCNYVNKIIPAIKSRTQEVEIKKLDKDQFKIKVIRILLEFEGIDLEESVLDTYIEAAYPDLRKCINMLQLNSQDGKLLPPDVQANSSDWQLAAVELFNQGKIRDGRKLVCEQIRPEEVDGFFTMCYQNLHWWSNNESEQDMAIIIIRDAIVKNVAVADVEINLAAMLIELARIKNGE